MRNKNSPKYISNFYLLETLKVDKNQNKTEALNDIYKVLRPGEAPSLEVAEEIFKIPRIHTAYPIINIPITFEMQNPLSLKDENKSAHNGKNKIPITSTKAIHKKTCNIILIFY